MSKFGKTYCYINTKTENISAAELTAYSTATLPADRAFSVGALTPSTVTEFFGITSAGALVSSSSFNDGVVMLGTNDFQNIDTNMVLAQTAAGDNNWGQAASLTGYIFCDSIKFPYRSTAGKGYKINSINWCYSVATADATSITPTLKLTTYANGVANSVAAEALSPTTLTVTHATTPRVVNTVVSTPIFVNATNQKLGLNLVVVTPSTSVFSFYGAVINYTWVPF